MKTKETKTVYAWAVVTKRGTLFVDDGRILIFQTRVLAEAWAYQEDGERAVKIAIVVPKP